MWYNKGLSKAFTLKLLALDIATKVGWASFEDAQLLSFGTLRLDSKLIDHGDYPFNYVDFTRKIAKEIYELVIVHKPESIVIEETNVSKKSGRYIQKLLEFIHLSFLQLLEGSGIKVFYISTSVWRKTFKLALSKEDKKNNAKVSEAKRKGKSKKEVGLTGKITNKHLSIRFINQKYGLQLKMKDQDAAEAIIMGLAFLSGAPLSDGKM